MKEKERKWTVFLLPLAVLVILIGFMNSVSRLEDGRKAEDREQLEDSLRRAAAACYAAEGIYPPDLEYMEEHYGIRIDEEHFAVKYDVIASNLMPDITVLDVAHEE